MGLTKPRAAQIYNLDYKQSTRVVTTTNITLAGGAPSQVDGVSLSLNNRVLVTGQSTASQNGLYYVTTVGSGSNGTWARTSDGNETGEIEAGMIVMVTEGTIYADTQWKLITDDPISIGTTALTFTQNYSANSISSGTSNVVVTSNANVTISSAGTANVLLISSTGTVTSGTASVTGNITGGNANITGTTAATSKTTGALVVGGGVGVASDVWAGNSITVDGGTYGNVVITQFASMYATANGPNPYSIMQVRSNDTTTGMGMRAYAGLNGQIYSNSGITFTTGATIKDKDFPTGGTSRATIDSTGLSVAGIASATGNITGANILTGGVVSATGNVTGNFFIGNGSQLTGIVVSAGTSLVNGTSNVVVAASGNTSIGVAGTSGVAVFATTGEYVTGLISATGNVTGNYILGNGALLTGVSTTSSNINNGTSNVTVVSSGGNVSVGISGTSNIAVFATTGEYVTGLVSASGNVIANVINSTSGLMLNSNTISTNFTLPSNYNAMSAGPITVATAVNVSIGDGLRWTIV